MKKFVAVLVMVGMVSTVFAGTEGALSASSEDGVKAAAGVTLPFGQGAAPGSLSGNTFMQTGTLESKPKSTASAIGDWVSEHPIITGTTAAILCVGGAYLIWENNRSKEDSQPQQINLYVDQNAGGSLGPVEQDITIVIGKGNSMSRREHLGKEPFLSPNYSFSR